MSRFTLGKDDKEGSLYDLFAVANHSGTVNFGHYTAFGRLAETRDPIDGLKRDGLGMSRESKIKKKNKTTTTTTVQTVHSTENFGLY